MQTLLLRLQYFNGGVVRTPPIVDRVLWRELFVSTTSANPLDRQCAAADTAAGPRGNVGRC